MSFEIGERVISHFAGAGSVVGPLQRDEDQIALQLIQFDLPILGERLYPISKLQTLEAEGETKAKSDRLQKAGGDGS